MPADAEDHGIEVHLDGLLASRGMTQLVAGRPARSTVTTAA